MLKQFKLYHRFLVQNNNTFTVIEHLNSAKANFDVFRTSSFPTMLGSLTRATASRPFSSPTHIVDLSISNFKKTVKCDQSLFTQYKEERHWDRWNTHTIAQAHAQDVYEVFDISYKPITPVEWELFALKQKYIFAVFTERLQTNYGKKLVRQHIANNSQ